jgi:hypothetical protein
LKKPQAFTHCGFRVRDQYEITQSRYAKQGHAGPDVNRYSLFPERNNGFVAAVQQARRVRCATRQPLFPEHTLDLRHVIMAYRISFSVVPSNGDLTPRRSDNRTKVSCRRSPANTVAGLEASGLIASHRRVNSGMRPFKRVLGQ